MSKKFNLVYDSKGTLKGSYSGVPGKDDVSLIERAVLEGSKPIPPAPKPEPAPTPEEPIEVSLDEFMNVITRLAMSEEYPLEYDQDYVCRATGMEFVDMWESIDADSLQWLVEDCATPWMSVFGWDLEQLFDDNNVMGVAGILGRYPFGEIHYGPLFGFSIETDAETGDSRVVAIGWPAEKVVELKFNRHK